MSKRLFLIFLAGILALPGVIGCRNRCCKDSYVASAPPPCAPPVAPITGMRPIHALSPQRYDMLPGPMPPTRQDMLGPPAVGYPPQPYAPPATLPTQPPVGEIRGYQPPAPPPPPPPSPPPSEPAWRPSPGAPSTPPGTEAYKEPAQLFPPESSEPPKAPSKPEPSTERPPSPPLPVGIAQYQMVRERVAAGLKPSLEGLDWLQNSGYRTVLFLRRPTEDDSGDRKQIEKRGMKYVSLEVSPQTLNQELVDEFNRIVTDSAATPLFIYDRDGVLQGALWYMHFRKVDLDSDEEARIRAARLGLRENQNDEQREMWLAIQKLLSGM